MKRNRLLYLFVLFLSLDFVYFYGGKMPYMLFYMTLSLPVVSILYTLLIFIGITQTAEDKTILKGESTIFSFCVRNKSIFFCPFLKVNVLKSFVSSSENSEAIYLSLPPLGYKSFSFEYKFLYRGSFDFGVESIELMDLLGIFKISKKINKYNHIIVFPKLICIKSFKIKSNYMSESHTMLSKTNEDMTTVSDVREYAYGDNFKRVHWKLSAKMDQLMVKNYESTSRFKVILMLDLKKNKIDFSNRIILEDILIESSIALTNYCLNSHIPVDFVYNQDEVVNLKLNNPSDFDNIYKTLASINFNQEIGIEKLMDIYLNQRATETNVVILTSNMSYELYEEIYKVKAFGYNIILIYASLINLDDDNSIQGQISDSLSELDVDVYTITPESEIRKVLEN